MWAITACTCLNNTPLSQISIRIGDPSMKGSTKHKFYKSDKTELHPQCIDANGSYHSENDIALIQLSEPFFDSRYVFIARIPYQLTYWTPDTTLTLDLATYSDLKDIANTLKSAVWSTVSQLLHPGVCLNHFSAKYYKAGKNMCSSYFHKNGTRDCELDIGASLGFDYALIGILVHKEKCGKDQAAGSFVNIPLHSQWIRKTVRKNTPWILL